MTYGKIRLESCNLPFFMATSKSTIRALSAFLVTWTDALFRGASPKAHWGMQKVNFGQNKIVSHVFQLGFNEHKDNRGTEERCCQSVWLIGELWRSYRPYHFRDSWNLTFKHTPCPLIGLPACLTVSAHFAYIWLQFKRKIGLYSTLFYKHAML